MRRSITISASIVLATNAFAQSSGAQAEMLFREGRALLAAGNVGGACAAFAKSQALEPATTTLINLAGCREQLGELATAWGLFLEAERTTRMATDPATQQLHEIARTRASAIEPRLSYLTINVPNTHHTDGLVVVRADERVDAVLWNRAVPVNGGTYTIKATAPNRRDWEQTVSIARENGRGSVVVPELAKLAVPPAVTARPSVVTRESRARSRAHLYAGGGAVLLTGAAIGFAVWGNATYDRAKHETTDQERRVSLYDAANTRRYLAIGSLSAGVAVAGTAVWLYLRGKHRTSERVTGSVSISNNGFAVGGAF